MAHLGPLQADNISKECNALRNYSLAQPEVEVTVNHDNALDLLGRCLREILIPIVCVFGVIGNILNIIILSKKRVKQTMQSQGNMVYFGLTSLALSDMMFCITAFPRCLIAENKALFSPYEFGLYYQLYCTGILTMFSLLSTWMIVTMASFRYIAICHPLHLRNWLTAERAYGVMIGVMITCICFNLPSFWQFKAEPLDLRDETLILVDIGQMNHDTKYGLAFQWIKKIFGVFIPVLILGFCNTCLVKALRISQRRRQVYIHRHHATHHQSGRQITRTLVAIIVIYILLVYPSELMDFTKHLLNIHITNTEVFLFFRAVANLLQVINFACNFILYCVLNAQFCQAVRDFLTCSRKYSDHRPTSLISLKTSKSLFQS